MQLGFRLLLRRGHIRDNHPSVRTDYTGHLGEYACGIDEVMEREATGRASKSTVGKGHPLQFSQRELRVGESALRRFVTSLCERWLRDIDPDCAAASIGERECHRTSAACY